MRFRVAAGAVLALASHPAFADSPRNGQGFAVDLLRPSDIVAIVRSAGLLATAPPVRSGPTYLVHATNRYGTPLRVVVDARFGEIVSFRYLAAAPPPRYGFPARFLNDRDDFPQPARMPIGGPPVRYGELTPPFYGPYDAPPRPPTGLTGAYYGAYAPPPHGEYGPPPPYGANAPPPHGEYGPPP